jgi:hypothetical protein
MLAKVVSTTSTAAARKTEAEQAAAKEKTEYETKKTAETVATDEYIAQNNQAEKEKKMIGEIRAMVCTPRHLRLFETKALSEPLLSLMNRRSSGSTRVNFILKAARTCW